VVSDDAFITRASSTTRSTASAALERRGARPVFTHPLWFLALTPVYAIVRERI
jgi:hypothetical protein